MRQRAVRCGSISCLSGHSRLRRKVQAYRGSLHRQANLLVLSWCAHPSSLAQIAQPPATTTLPVSRSLTHSARHDRLANVAIFPVDLLNCLVQLSDFETPDAFRPEYDTPRGLRNQTCDCRVDRRLPRHSLPTGNSGRGACLRAKSALIKAHWAVNRLCGGRQSSFARA